VPHPPSPLTLGVKSAEIPRGPILREA
jgi:hypothetical protein